MTQSTVLNGSLNEALRGRVVVTDTSSLLIAGTHLLDALSECRVVLPAVVVKELEEKRTHPTLGFISREWLRLIEKYRISDGDALRTGIELIGYDNVTLQIEPNHSNQESLPLHLRDKSVDSTILAVAKNLSDEGAKVTLLSNDMPMRLHATLDLKIDALEYASSDNSLKPFNGRFKLDIEANQVDELAVYQDGFTEELIEAIEDNMDDDAPATSFTEIYVDGRSTNKAAICTNDSVLQVTPKVKASSVTGKTLEQNVLLELLKLDPEDLPVVSVGGGAGTGKTLLTMAVALEELKYHKYERIMVFRSLHEMGVGQEMGFLPGDVDAKMGPWAGAIWDAVETIARLNKPLKKNATLADVEKQKAEADRLKAMVEIAPITYLRGRSLDNTFMVLEEAQNFSRSEILNILSRTGKNTKVVLTWDSNQIDNRFLKTGSQADIWSVVDSLKDESIFGHITLTRTERSLVAEVTSRILEDQIN